MSGLFGASGTRFGGKNRTAWDRINAIPAAVARGEAFRQRVTEAAGDAVKLADLMAEAIAMAREARGLDSVGRDGRSVVGVEEMQAAYCMDAAAGAYLKARGSNA